MFAAGNVYDLFFLYTKADTRQTYQLFVGKNIPPPAPNKTFADTNVKFGYENRTLKFKFMPAPNGGATPAGWSAKYDGASGILTLQTNMAAQASNYDLSQPKSAPLGQTICQPSTICTWSTSANRCQCNPNSPYASLCNQVNPAHQTVCDWSVKDFDCPALGCPAIQITFPSSEHFVADDSDQRPAPKNFGLSMESPFDWNVNFGLPGSSIAGQQCTYGTQQPDTVQACPAVRP